MPFDPKEPAQLEALRRNARNALQSGDSKFAFAVLQDELPALLMKFERMRRAMSVMAMADGGLVGNAIADLMEKNDRLRALLREIEWKGNTPLAELGIHPGPGGTCPLCERERHVGHMPDCRLFAEMEE